MPEVKPIKVFKLVNPNGDKIQLHFGILKFTEDLDGDKDTGFRWMFTGKKIPMPVWSGDWFKGHPETTMLDWLKENGGWVVHAIWTVKTNKITVLNLPAAPEAKTETDWVPVSSGKYPADNVTVQVTYLSSRNGSPKCDAAAYRRDGNWIWCDNETRVLVEITAWRHCNPYKGDATASATKPEPKADTNIVYFVDDGDGDLDSLHKFTGLEEAKEYFNATAYGAGYPNVQLYKATKITEEV